MSKSFRQESNHGTQTHWNFAHEQASISPYQNVNRSNTEIVIRHYLVSLDFSATGVMMSL